MPVNDLLICHSLKSRHIQFIALGGTIGTGLFLGIGTAFANAGPVSVLLGYSITGLAVFGMMQSLGEMSTWLPLPGAIPQYCARYADPALGFAVGWNNCKSFGDRPASGCSYIFQGTNAPSPCAPKSPLQPLSLASGIPRKKSIKACGSRSSSSSLSA